jgi:hypothetical protein
MAGSSPGFATGEATLGGTNVRCVRLRIDAATFTFEIMTSSFGGSNATAVGKLCVAVRLAWAGGATNCFLAGGETLV